MAQPMVTTSIRIRPEIAEALERLKARRAAAAGVGARSSLGAVVEELVERELARLEAERRESAHA